MGKEKKEGSENKVKSPGDTLLIVVCLTPVLITGLLGLGCMKKANSPEGIKESKYHAEEAKKCKEKVEKKVYKIRPGEEEISLSEDGFTFLKKDEEKGGAFVFTSIDVNATEVYYSKEVKDPYLVRNRFFSMQFELCQPEVRWLGPRPNLFELHLPEDFIIKNMQKI